MKKLVFFLILFTAAVNAQIVNIPDANFKFRLLTADVSNTIAYGGGVPIKIDANNNGEIEVAEAQTVDSLNVESLIINDLTGISNFNNLKKLDCDNNELEVLDVTNLTSLIVLNCGYNNLIELDLSGLTNLRTLHCVANGLNFLNLTEVNNLQFLNCEDNNLTTIDLIFCSDLKQLWIANNQLSVLNVSNLINLEYFICYGNLFTTLNLQNLSALTQLNCGASQLTELDVSMNHNLAGLYINGSPLLQRIYMKNGAIESYNTSNFSGCTALEYICADEGQIVEIQGLLNAQNMDFVVVHSYCSFVPGGSYNTIAGSITFDSNNNGCDASDGHQPNIRVNINDSIESGASFTNNSGAYTFYTQTGNFVVAPSIENPTWFNFSPASATIPFANTNNNVVTQNFCLSANGVHPDIEVVIAPITSARPGFDAQYKIVYKNKGNQTLSGNVTFSYDDAVLDFVSSTVVPNAQSTGLLRYDYTNLLPFENRSFYITLNVNEPGDTPAVNIGDQLNFTATINPIAGDVNPSDNTFQFRQTVVGSFDPNEIICIEGNVVPPSEIGNYLHYIINFENTGTADAQNIVVRDVIDTAQFDVNSLQVLNSSAGVTARLNGNIAEFIFQNINLHSGGHGNILLKMKTKNTLVAGNTVSKKANIYFDYNFPVETVPENTVFQQLNTTGFDLDASISVYPNPTKGTINIKCSNTIKSVQLFDIQGRLLQTSLVNQNETILDASENSNGVYFIKVLSDKGILVQKIIKE